MYGEDLRMVWENLCKGRDGWESLSNGSNVVPKSFSAVLIVSIDTN